MKIKKIELSYIAGLIDGEGSVTLTKNCNNERRGVLVCISSTTKELVDFVQTKLGGKIYGVPKYQEHHKTQYRWQVTRNAAIDVLKQISPFLQEPEKKRRTKLILDKYKKLTPRNGKYTEEMLKEKIKFEQEFFENSTKVNL